MLPWTDRTGSFSALKCTAFVAALAPALWIAVEASRGWLGSRPVMEAVHQSGLWSIRFLALGLAVTPLQVALRAPKLVATRRILGVAAFAYAALHVFLYVFDQKFALGHVAAEIGSRLYLMIGFVGFVGFCVLGATSTDAMIARLGSRRWTRLQQFVYPCAAIATVHFFMQSKLDVSQPILMAGIFALLLGFRAARHWFGDLSTARVAALGVTVAVATALGEAIWFRISTGAPVLAVLAANLDFSYMVRPAWLVLGAGAVLFVARLSRPRPSGPRFAWFRAGAIRMLRPVAIGRVKPCSRDLP